MFLWTHVCYKDTEVQSRHYMRTAHILVSVMPVEDQSVPSNQLREF
jgi:hypothetical protein